MQTYEVVAAALLQVSVFTCVRVANITCKVERHRLFTSLGTVVIYNTASTH